MLGRMLEMNGKLSERKRFVGGLKFSSDGFVPVTEERHEGCRTAGFRVEMRFGTQTSTFRDYLSSRYKST